MIDRYVSGRRPAWEEIFTAYFLGNDIQIFFMIPLSFKQDTPTLKHLNHPFTQLFLYYDSNLCTHVIV